MVDHVTISFKFLHVLNELNDLSRLPALKSCDKNFRLK